MLDYTRRSTGEFPAIFDQVIVQKHLNAIADAERFAAKIGSGHGGGSRSRTKEPQCISSGNRHMNLRGSRAILTCKHLGRTLVNAPLTIMENCRPARSPIGCRL